MSLFQRGNTYWIKVRVPKDLLEIYGGEFIRESLCTTKQREARRSTTSGAAKLNPSLTRSVMLVVASRITSS
jgi:hypothetical protein